MADSHYMNDSSSRDATAEADLTEREALLTIDTFRTLVLLRSVAEKTCDVLVYEPPSFWVNDTGELQTDYGAIKVRVASVFRMDEDEGAEPVYRVVLEEIDGRPIDDEAVAPEPKRRMRTSRLYYFPWRRVTAIAVVVIALPILGYSTYYGGRAVWQYYLNKAVAEARMAEANAGAPHEQIDKPIAAPKVATPVVTSATTTVAQVTTKTIAAAPATSAATTAAPTFEQLHRPGARSFVVPEVVTALGMTAQQTTSLKNVNEAAEQAVRDLDRLWPSDSSDQHARRLSMVLDVARQQSLRLLTTEQRRRLSALSRQ